MTVENYYVSSSKEKAALDRQKKLDGKVTHDDFINLLITQLRNQDPMNPINNDNFVQQMAQLQALDEQTATTKTLQSMRIESQFSMANNLIGKIASAPNPYASDSGNAIITGYIASVSISNGEVYVHFENGQKVLVEKVNAATSATSIKDQNEAKAAEKALQESIKTTNLATQLQAASNLIGAGVVGTTKNGEEAWGIVIGAHNNNGVIEVELLDGRTIPIHRIESVIPIDLSGIQNGGPEDGVDDGDGTDGGNGDTIPSEGNDEP